MFIIYAYTVSLLIPSLQYTTSPFSFRYASVDLPTFTPKSVYSPSAAIAISYSVPFIFIFFNVSESILPSIFFLVSVTLITLPFLLFATETTSSADIRDGEISFPFSSYTI